MMAYMDHKSGEEICERCVERLLLNAAGPYHVDGEFECSICGEVSPGKPSEPCHDAEFGMKP